jgi:hypothetical protein
MLLDQIDALTAQTGQLTARAGGLIAQIPAARGADAGGTAGPDAGKGPDAAVLPAAARLDEITGCGIIAAHAVIAEIGPDMSVSGTRAGWCPGRNAARRPASPARRTPPRPPARATRGSTGRPARSPPRPPAPAPSPASAAAASPSGAGNARPWPPSPAPSWSFIFRLLAGPAARYRDLGPGYHDERISAERKIRSHVRQLEAPGLTVTIVPRAVEAERPSVPFLPVMPVQPAS